MDFEIKECCEALRVSRSGYYRWGRAEPSRREKENAQLVEQIREVFEANKSRYGSPRVTRELRQRGLKCGQNRIARLMRENKLAACAKKAFRPRTTLPGDGASPNLIKGMEPSRVNQVWVSDITYIATLEGWLYLAIILDLFSRKVVGLETGRNLGSRVGRYRTGKRIDDAYPGPGALFPFRSRQPVQQPGCAQTFEGDRSQSKYERLRKLLR